MVLSETTMATKSLMDQFISFAAPAQNLLAARDPVSVFFAKIERQIGFAEHVRRQMI
jgi:hypothetical protein